MADFSVKLTIKGDGTVAVNAVKDVEAATTRMATTAGTAGAAAGKSFEATE